MSGFMTEKTERNNRERVLSFVPKMVVIMNRRFLAIGAVHRNWWRKHAIFNRSVNFSMGRRFLPVFGLIFRMRALNRKFSKRAIAVFNSACRSTKLSSGESIFDFPYICREIFVPPYIPKFFTALRVRKSTGFFDGTYLANSPQSIFLRIVNVELGCRLFNVAGSAYFGLNHG